MTLKVTVPVTLDASNLVATNVPEADYGVWNSGTTYAVGARCIKTGSIYESVQASNTNHDPTTGDESWWLRVGPTNRWKAFDLDQVDWTSNPTSLYYEFTPGAINAVHLIGLRDATSIRIRLTDPVAGLVYDSDDTGVGRVPVVSGWWAWGHGPRKVVDQTHFYQIPEYADAVLRIDMAGGASLGAQNVLAGSVREFGMGVTYGARLGIDSYSKVTTNQWGVASLRKGYYNRRVAFTLVTRWNEFDPLTDFLVESDARVQVWNIDDRFRGTKVLGFLRTWEQTLSNFAVVDVNFEIQGVAANG